MPTTADTAPTIAEVIASDESYFRQWPHVAQSGVDQSVRRLRYPFRVSAG
jgi:hypothetical protein